MCFQHSKSMHLNHEFSTEIFDLWMLWIGIIILYLVLRIQRSKIYVWLHDILVSFWFWKRVARVRLLCWFNDEVRDAALLPWFLLKIRSVRIMDTIVCLGTLLWLFSPAWDAIKLTLKVCFVCPLVVIVPTDLGATMELFLQASCLSIFTNLRRRIPAFLPMVIKLACLWGVFFHICYLWQKWKRT